MSVVVTLNGVPYQIPTVGETGWGQEVTNYLVALGSGGVLTLEGGNFTLLNEVDFGPTYGLASPYFRSGQDPAASVGVVRLTNTEGIYWRNATDTGDLGLYVNGNQLYFNGNVIGGSPLTTKGDVYTYSTIPTRLPVGSNGQVLTADSSTATGLAWTTVGGGGGGSVVGFTFTDANGIAGTVANPTTTPNLTLSLGDITPTSVAASGTISGSNFSGTFNGTFSGTSSGTNTGDQTITLTGDVTGSGTGSFATTLATVSIAKGGTGQTTANDALNALLPSQAGNAGKILYTDGTNTAWQSVAGGGSVTSVSGGGTQGVSVAITNPTTTPNIVVGLGAITPTSVAASGTVTGSNISGTVSGTNTGDQTITLTGDVTGSGTGAFAATLANTAVTPGTYTLAGITVDSKGRITAAGNGTVTLTGDVTGSGGASFATTLSTTGVTPGTYNNLTVDSKGRATSGSNVSYLTANQTITVSGDASGSGSTSIALTLANTAVTPGSYTLANITVDSKGRITAASNGTAVSSVAVTASSNISGSVSNPTTTPNITLDLVDTAVTPGTYGSASAIPVITVDSKGRVTSLSTVTGGAGSVTSVSFTNANGFTGSVVNPTTTPAISVGTSVTGILYGNGSSVSTAIAANFPTLNQNTTGSAAFLTTTRSITATGDANWTVNFNGAANVSAALTLANTAVTPGSYTNANITVDSKGRITAASSGTVYSTFISLTDTPASYSGQGGKVVEVNSGETALQFTALSPITTDDVTNVSTVDGTTLSDALDNLLPSTFSGVATLTAGSVTVSTSLVNTGDLIMLTHQTLSGTQGILSVGTITDGVSFVINSSSGSDAGTVGWYILK